MENHEWFHDFPQSHIHEWFQVLLLHYHKSWFIFNTMNSYSCLISLLWIHIHILRLWILIPIHWIWNQIHRVLWFKLKIFVWLETVSTVIWTSKSNLDHNWSQGSLATVASLSLEDLVRFSLAQWAASPGWHTIHIWNHVYEEYSEIIP